MSKRKEYVLIKDIVIPAGTRMLMAPQSTTMSGDFKEALIGLTKDTCGSFFYPVTGDDEELLKEYFRELR